MNIGNITIVLPGEPQDQSLEIGKRVAIWFHENLGKEIVYKIVSPKNLMLPAALHKQMCEMQGCFLTLEAMADEDWNSDQAQIFMTSVGQKAWEFAQEIFGDMEDEGEEWKNGSCV